MEALILLSQAVTLVQGLAALTGAFDQVSEIISKRIAEGRKVWTEEEKKAIMDAVEAARADAVGEVDKLP